MGQRSRGLRHQARARVGDRVSKPIADPRTGEVLDVQSELSDAGINCEVMSGTAPSYA